MSKSIQLRPATPDDIGCLAEMNQQLIIDERRQSDLTLPQLVERMRRWLEAGRHAILIIYRDQVIGYMLYWRHPDEFYPYKDSIFVRQFFIEPSYRRRGLGQLAFEQIVTRYFDQEAAITLDVIADNLEGRAFWEKVGFVAYHTTMRRAASSR